MNYHCMIDLETLGLRCNPVILSIGAVLFDTKGVVFDKFYRNVNPARYQRAGLSIAGLPVSEVLKQLCDFMCSPISWGDGFIGIWGNGIKADIVWLESAYQAAEFTTPWSCKQERCYRTFRAQHGDIPMPDHTGTAHNALDDALYQVDFIRNVCSAKNIEVL